MGADQGPIAGPCCHMWTIVVGPLVVLKNASSRPSRLMASDTVVGLATNPSRRRPVQPELGATCQKWPTDPPSVELPITSSRPSTFRWAWADVMPNVWPCCSHALHTYGSP